MPYEHLFLGIFPSLENNEVKPSPDPSPAPFNSSQENTSPPQCMIYWISTLIQQYIAMKRHLLSTSKISCNCYISSSYLRGIEGKHMRIGIDDFYLMPKIQARHCTAIAKRYR
ncbi:hypothetical protein NQ318_007303 [Aromia moschata]|uniref:Uncharacterized protein n=1 Tax=Aromia moschata TaxID=1265417 RepID=A0AAV8YZV1_9CUCU|nr:hypothetical protein NQ318_007303 [Aromia moschata]